MLLGTALCVVLAQSPLQPTHFHLIDDPMPAVAGPTPVEPQAEPSRGTVWWTVLGVSDGVLYLGTLGFVIAGAAAQWRADGGYAVALAGSTAVGAVAGGVGGWYLGELARSGSAGSKVALIVLGALAVTAGLVSCVYGIASLGSIGFQPN